MPNVSLKCLAELSHDLGGSVSSLVSWRGGKKRANSAMRQHDEGIIRTLRAETRWALVWIERTLMEDWCVFVYWPDFDFHSYKGSVRIDALLYSSSLNMLLSWDCFWLAARQHFKGPKLPWGIISKRIQYQQQLCHLRLILALFRQVRRRPTKPYLFHRMCRRCLNASFFGPPHTWGIHQLPVIEAYLLFFKPSTSSKIGLTARGRKPQWQH